MLIVIVGSFYTLYVDMNMSVHLMVPLKDAFNVVDMAASLYF